jgi:hypothetical protein
MGKGQQVQGEGNYEASRTYNEATKRFVESGKVDKAAHDAAPATDAEALQLAAAEAEGKSRAKEEDPMLTRKAPTKRAPGADDTEKRAPGEGDDDTPETAPEDTGVPKPGEGA